MSRQITSAHFHKSKTLDNKYVKLKSSRSNESSGILPHRLYPSLFWVHGNSRAEKETHKKKKSVCSDTAYFIFSITSRDGFPTFIMFTSLLGIGLFLLDRRLVSEIRGPKHWSCDSIFWNLSMRLFRCLIVVALAQFHYGSVVWLPLPLVCCKTVLILLGSAY